MNLNHLIPIEGIATTWQAFRPAEGSRFRSRFAPYAFNCCLAASGHTVPLQINHQPSEQLSGVVDARLTATSKGLELTATINTRFDRNKAAILAIQYGWLTGMSIGYIVRAKELSRDAHGPLWLITRADVFEASLVDTPLVPGTSISTADRSMIASTVPARPTNFTDCQLLAGLIGRIDHCERFWSGSRKPVPPRVVYVRDLPSTKAALAKIEARRAQERTVQDIRQYHALIASGGVVTLDPISGETVRPSDYVIHGLPLLGSRSMCLV